MYMNSRIICKRCNTIEIVSFQHNKIMKKRHEIRSLWENYSYQTMFIRRKSGQNMNRMNYDIDI